MVLCDAVMSITVAIMSLTFERLWVVIPVSPYFDSLQSLGLTSLIMLVGGIIAFFMVWTEFAVIANTSALTFMIAGTFKELVTGDHPDLHMMLLSSLYAQEQAAWRTSSMQDFDIVPSKVARLRVISIWSGLPSVMPVLPRISRRVYLIVVTNVVPTLSLENQDVCVQARLLITKLVGSAVLAAVLFSGRHLTYINCIRLVVVVVVLGVALKPSIPGTSGARQLMF